MKYSSIFFAIIMMLCCAACNSSSSNSKQEDNTNNTAPAPTQQTASAENLASYPSIPVELMQKLFLECDYLDVIFNGSYYGVSLSMSQDQKRDIQQSLSFITTGDVRIDPACKSVGRMFFLKQGSTLLEADFFLQDNCQYYIFYEGNTAKYANPMSEQGVKFFMGIIQQASKARGQ